MSIDTSVSASMFKTEKDFLRAKYKFQSKEEVEAGGGKTPLATLLAKKKYFEDAKLTWTDATAGSLSKPDKLLGVNDASGSAITGDTRISMSFAYLDDEQWAVIYSGSGVSTEADQESPTEDTEGEFTLVGENNGWNFKIKKADWGPFGTTNISNIVINSTTHTTATVIANVDGYVTRLFNQTHRGSSITWESHCGWATGTTQNDSFNSLQISTTETGLKWECSRPCIAFNISGTIPSGKTIHSAELQVTYKNKLVTDTPDAYEFKPFRWTGVALISGVDFNDFDEANNSTFDIDGVSDNTTMKVPIDGDLLTHLQSNYYTNKYGIMLRGKIDYEAGTVSDPTDRNYINLYSEDAPSLAYHPRLIITYR